MKYSDDFYMQKALLYAQKAFKKGEVPIGAVVVDEQGAILASAANAMEKEGCQTGHAEIRAIKRATKKKKNWRLNDCWIYVTLEPCLMCYGLIRLSRLAGIVYAASSPLFGAFTNNRALSEAAEKEIIIQQGLKDAESIAILKMFFTHARKKEVDSESQKRFFGPNGTSIAREKK